MYFNFYKNNLPNKLVRSLITFYLNLDLISIELICLIILRGVSSYKFYFLIEKRFFIKLTEKDTNI